MFDKITSKKVFLKLKIIESFNFIIFGLKLKNPEKFI